MTPITLLIAEDQAMVRGALVALLGLEPDLQVLDAVPDGQAALEAARRLKPRVVLTDIEMPRKTGLELAADLKNELPATTTIILTTFARAGYLRRALDAGVRGYLLKDAPSEVLANAIRRVAQGMRVIDPDLALAAWEGKDPLNERERQVLRLAGEGMKSADIAVNLHLSQGTVRNYLSEAISKLNAENRIEAYRLARAQGWL
jgi:two-component system, NarL family, response regulator DesR